MKKNLIAAMLTLAITVIPFASSAASVTIDLNGSTLQVPQAPIVESGTTLVPFRPVFEGIGLNVGWDPATQTVTGSNNDYTIKLVIGSTAATVNGETKTMAVAPKVVNGSTLIPVRFIAESVGYYVGWDEGRQKVILRDYDYSKYTVLYGNNYNETIFMKDLYTTEGTGAYEGYQELHGFIDRGFGVFFSGSSLALDDRRGLDPNETIPFIYENYSTISRQEAYQLLSSLGLTTANSLKSYFGKFYDEWNSRNIYYNTMSTVVQDYRTYESGKTSLLDQREKLNQLINSGNIPENEWLSSAELGGRGLRFAKDPITNEYVFETNGISYTEQVYAVPDYSDEKLPKDGSEVEFNGVRMKFEYEQIYFHAADIEKIEAMRE